MPTFLIPSAPLARLSVVVDGIDQDQTAQNVQSDLDLCRPPVNSSLYDKILLGLCRSYLHSSKEVGFALSDSERVKPLTTEQNSETVPHEEYLHMTFHVLFKR